MRQEIFYFRSLGHPTKVEKVERLLDRNAELMISRAKVTSPINVPKIAVFKLKCLVTRIATLRSNIFDEKNDTQLVLQSHLRHIFRNCFSINRFCRFDFEKNI